MTSSVTPPRWRIAVVFEVDAADEDEAIQAGDDIVTVCGTTSANPTYNGDVLAGGRQDRHVSPLGPIRPDSGN